MSTATSIEEQLRTMQLEHLRQVTDSISHDLLTISSNDLPKLPEQIFVSQFLPVFSGEQTPNINSDIMRIWLGIAGSHTGEVSIIDHTGREIYKVPPIFDTDRINVSNRQPGQSFSDIAATSALYSNNIVAVGEQYLNSALSEKVDEIVSGNQSTYQERWTAIFQRYNKLPSATNVVKVKDDGDDELIDYDA